MDTSSKSGIIILASYAQYEGVKLIRKCPGRLYSTTPFHVAMTDRPDQLAGDCTFVARSSGAGRGLQAVQ